MSNGLANVAKSVVDTITSSAGMAKLEGSIQNIGSAISNAAPGIGKFTDGLLGLVQSFTGKPLQGIVDWFNKVGDSFSAWVEKMTRPSWFTGKTPLEEAFSGLGDTLKIVLDALVDIGKQASTS
ncbi:Uncharacterised protein [Mycolicibacterium aichiense]|nr:Uncharacterised protein [Mycolicibacterium aichiense]